MAAVFDLHCDTPHNISKKKFNHVRPEKLFRQEYLGAVFAHFVMPEIRYPFVDAVRLLSSTLSYCSNNNNLQIISRHHEVARKRTNIILGVEGGHIFDSSDTQVEALFHLGVRVFTLTWNNSNKLAYSALEADRKGLTKKGRQFLRNLQRLRPIIDLSHAATRSALDVCDLYAGPVMASHSCVRTLNKTFLRNIDDRVIKAVHEHNGVVGVNFSRFHLGQYSIADHVDYLVQNFGIAVAAIGSDFDGIDDAVLKDPSELCMLERALIERGYCSDDIEKIFNGNFLRLFEEVGGRQQNHIQ